MNEPIVACIQQFHWIDLLGSVFIALVGAWLGAFYGATAAQNIAEKSKSRAELANEICNTNAAIATAYIIFSAFLALKKQHTHGVKTQYDEQKAMHDQAARDQQAGKNFSQPSRVYANFLSLQRLTIPTDVLSKIIFERLNVANRPLNLCLQLSRTAADLNASIETLNDFAQSRKAENESDPEKLAAMYFGARYNNREDLTYPTALQALCNQTDDGIFFSKLLCDDLHAHGESLKIKYMARFKYDAPRVSKVSFDFPAAKEMMSDEKNYASWLTSFVKADD